MQKYKFVGMHLLIYKEWNEQLDSFLKGKIQTGGGETTMIEEEKSNWIESAEYDERRGNECNKEFNLMMKAWRCVD